MNSNTLRIVFAIFLIAHGLIHYSLTYVPVPKPGELRTPFWPSWARTDTDPGWLATKMGLSNNVVRGLGSALWLLTVAGFAVAGLGLLGIPGLNRIWEGSAHSGGSRIVNSIGFLLASMADCRCVNQSGGVSRGCTALAKIIIFINKEFQYKKRG